MGMYGVEEEFWVDEYHFEVSFSSDNAVGLCQRDVTVGHSRSVEDLALSDFTGLQLLEAYTGPDRVMRQETLAHQVEFFVPPTKRRNERHMRTVLVCCAKKRKTSSVLRKLLHRSYAPWIGVCLI